MKKFFSVLLLAAMVLTLASGTAFAAEPKKDASEVLGAIEGNVYANELLGIMASFSDDWYVLNEEEIAEAMGYTADMMGDDKLAEQLRNYGIVCDLYVSALDDSGDINIQIEDLGFRYGLSLIMSEEDYVKAAAPQVQTALEWMGAENVKITSEKVDFAGGEHQAWLLTGEFDGMMFYERTVMIKAGNYMATVTAFSFSRESAEKMIGMFEAYDAEKLAA